MPQPAYRMQLWFNALPSNRKTIVYYLFIVPILLFSLVFLFFGLIGSDFALIIVNFTIAVFCLLGLYKVSKAKKKGKS